MRYSRQQRPTRSGSSNVTDTGDALRVRPLDQTTVALTTRRQLHDDADAVAAALRGAVRVGRRLRSFKELVDGRAAVYSAALRAVRATPTTTRTSTTVRSAPPTCCAGNTGPARRCSSSGSRGARTTLEPGGFRFGRDFRDIFGVAAEERVPRQAGVLAELLQTALEVHVAPSRRVRRPQRLCPDRVRRRTCLERSPHVRCTLRLIVAGAMAAGRRSRSSSRT